MVLVTRVKNHEQHKLELLKRINKYEADENMRWDHYYGDYQVSPFVEQSEAPEYMKYFYDNMAQDILRSVGNKLGNRRSNSFKGVSSVWIAVLQNSGLSRSQSRVWRAIFSAVSLPVWPKNFS